MGNYTCAKPGSKQEALELLKEAGGKGCIAAGCTNVMPDIRQGKIPDGAFLVDLSGLDELKGIRLEGKSVIIGALTTISGIMESPVITDHGRILQQAGKKFADPLVRNRATIGGNLANASPAADGVVPLLVLDAFLKVERLGTQRIIPVVDFLTGPGRSALLPGEMITAVSFASTRGFKSAFLKFGLRKSMAISLASTGVVLEMDKDRLLSARVALGALAPVPVRAKQVESFLAGKIINQEVLSLAAGLAAAAVNPITDIRASREYRLHLAGVLFKRAVITALSQGGEN